MTEAEARSLLRGPLTFGDDLQVAAVKFLEDCAQCRTRVARCRRCDGDGVNRRGYACPWCAEGYSEDVLRACGIDAKQPGPVEVRGTSDKGRISGSLVDPLP